MPILPDLPCSVHCYWIAHCTYCDVMLSHQLIILCGSDRPDQKWLDDEQKKHSRDCDTRAQWGQTIATVASLQMISSKLGEISALQMTAIVGYKSHHDYKILPVMLCSVINSSFSLWVRPTWPKVIRWWAEKHSQDCDTRAHTLGPDNCYCTQSSKIFLEVGVN